MFRTLIKDANTGGLYCFWIELTNHVQKKDVKDVSCAILAFEDSGVCARMELLSNLNIEGNAAYRRDDGNTEFGNTSDRRRDKFYRRFISGTKIDLNGLKPAAAVGDCDVNAHRVDKLEVTWNFHAECEFVKSQRGSAFERRKSIPTAVAGQANIHILRSTGPIGKSQLKRRTTLEVVVGDDILIDRSLKYAA
ncbi:MAG TPA: hypothetical protein VGF86_06990 [Candidatus Tumulicola sp.]|jgi:hypothetical protein